MLLAITGLILSAILFICAFIVSITECSLFLGGICAKKQKQVYQTLPCPTTPSLKLYRLRKNPLKLRKKSKTAVRKSLESSQNLLYGLAAPPSFLQKN
jgi:hypothetical protein